MKRRLKKIIAILLMCLTAFSFASCRFELEKPEWLETILCDHIFGETEVVKEATCGTKGKRKEVCIECGKTEYYTIKETGDHIFDEGVAEDGTLTNTTSWNEQAVAGGAHALDKSQAVLKKVVGSTVAYDKDENGLNGKLANASFAGIESTNADGTKTSTLSFPKTETPLGTTIDLESKKITNYGVDIVLTGTESDGLLYYQYGSGENQRNGIRLRLKQAENFAKGYCTDGEVAEDASQLNGAYKIAIGYNNSTDLLWVGFIDVIGITAKGENPTDTNTVIQEVQAYLAQRYADGNPVTIRYVSGILQSERDFTFEEYVGGNTYTVYKNGTETVQGNDGAIYDAYNTMTVSYECVCTVCGKIKPKEETKPCSHVFGEGVQADGVITYTCTVCGEIKKETVQETIPPTCSHIDINNDLLCDNCSEDLYIFNDESLYTEVEAVVGEAIAGNWYRVYGKQRVIEGQSQRYEAEGFKINPSNDILFGYGIGDHNKGGCYIASSSLGDFDMQTILAVRSGENEIGTYTDFYINLGSCTISIYGTETTIEITEETAISQIINKVYRLEEIK